MGIKKYFYKNYAGHIFYRYYITIFGFNLGVYYERYGVDTFDNNIITLSLKKNWIKIGIYKFWFGFDWFKEVDKEE